MEDDPAAHSVPSAYSAHSAHLPRRRAVHDCAHVCTARQRQRQNAAHRRQRSPRSCANRLTTSASLNRIASRAEAIRRLVEDGLKANGFGPGGAKRRS